MEEGESAGSSTKQQVLSGQEHGVIYRVGEFSICVYYKVYFAVLLDYILQNV